MTPFDVLPLPDRLALMNAADAAVPGLVAAAADDVAALVARAVRALRAGGRVVYLGAGSAGRIAAQDAAEVGPTYGVEGAFVAVVAGGATALRDAAEGLEDDEQAAVADLETVDLGPADLLVAVSASGSTPYTRAGLALARRRGARSAAVVCARDSPMAQEADLAVVVPIGPEVIEGSTRLAAGTAQKLVLNQLSTLAMVELGHVYGNLMIGVRAENAKLRARALRAVAVASGRPDAEAAAALDASDGDAKVALVMVRLGVDAVVARDRLARADGDVRAALGERGGSPARVTPRTAGLAVGVDVGGTKIAAGLVDAAGRLTARVELPTPATAVELDAAVAAAVADVRPGPGVPVGVATAGLVDPGTGLVRAVNVAWSRHPVRDRLQALVGSPVAIGNDAAAAAWAEHRFGAGRSRGDLVLVTVGTGLGAGFVVGGRLLTGAHGLAAEVGHQCLVPGGRPCRCGALGCWERYVSGSALAEQARALGPRWSPAGTREVVPAVLAAARTGDPAAAELLDEQGRRLGQGLAVVTSLLDPDVVVVGGGLAAAAGELLLSPARISLAEGVTPALGRALPDLVPARLGRDAGVVGAADLARHAPAACAPTL